MLEFHAIRCARVRIGMIGFTSYISQGDFAGGLDIIPQSMISTKSSQIHDGSHDVFLTQFTIENQVPNDDELVSRASLLTSF